MSCLKTFAILTSVCVIGLSVYLYSPIPEGISEPWKVRSLLAAFKVVKFIVSTMEMVGFDSNINCTRYIMNKMSAQGATSKTDPLLEVTDTLLGGVKGRIYRPKTAKTPSPALVFFHGGGWVMANPDFVDHLIAEIAKSTGIVVISVDYRLAPEYPFPIPFEDCVTATLHLLHNSETYGVDGNQIAVGGESAGGNLAAAVALFLSSHAQLPDISLQILFNPSLQLINFKLPSYVHPNNQKYLEPLAIASYWAHYLGPTTHPNLAQAMLDNQHTSPLIKKSHYADIVNASLNMPKEFLSEVQPEDLNSGNETLWKEIEDKALNHFMSPLIAQDVSKVAPAVIVTAEFDPLRDEGILYAERLRKSGVKVTHRDYKMLHGFVVFPHMFEISRNMTRDAVNDLKKHFRLE